MTGSIERDRATTPAGRVPQTTVEVVTKGAVGEDDVGYGRSRIAHLVDGISDPVLLARVKLTTAPDPARERPAIAQATLDLDGTLLRAHVAGHDMHEAIDLLYDRLRDRVEHARQRREALRRHQPPPATPGHWRHGSATEPRPEYFDRPPDEREIVRHKSYAASELTADEAAFEMDGLDYDFHLFRELGTGTDAVIERGPDASYRLRRARTASTTGSAPGGAYPVEVDPRSVPKLTVADAIEQLVDGGERYVFFVDTQTGRGAVLYHRYDGHYGLLTLT
jgi:ribosome-associated translation inhibitor RaiA